MSQCQSGSQSIAQSLLLSPENREGDSPNSRPEGHQTPSLNQGELYAQGGNPRGKQTNEAILAGPVNPKKNETSNPKIQPEIRESSQYRSGNEASNPNFEKEIRAPTKTEEIEQRYCSDPRLRRGNAMQSPPVHQYPHVFALEELEDTLIQPVQSIFEQVFRPFRVRHDGERSAE